MCWRQVERQLTKWLHFHQSTNHCNTLLKAIEIERVKNLKRIIPINPFNYCKFRKQCQLRFKIIICQSLALKRTELTLQLAYPSNDSQNNWEKNV